MTNHMQHPNQLDAFVKLQERFLSDVLFDYTLPEITEWLSNLKAEEIQDHRNIEKEIDRITLDQVKSFIKNAKDQWSKVETKKQRDQFFKEIFSKITITNEIIKCYISYDKITNHLTGIDLIIDEIPRNPLMKNSSSKA